MISNYINIPKYTGVSAKLKWQMLWFWKSNVKKAPIMSRDSQKQTSSGINGDILRL